jgi:hypothetical protein
MGSAWMSAGSGHAVLPERLVGDRYRQHVIAGLGERIVIWDCRLGPALMSGE